MSQITQPDPTGGYGSFPTSLLNIITGGLQTVAIGEGTKRYGFAFGADGRQYANANEGLVSAAAPASTPSMAAQAESLLSNPWVLVAGFGAIVIVALLVRG